MTNWTDATLFLVGDIVLPPFFQCIADEGGVTNYHTEVKRDIERMINEKWRNVGRYTETSTDDFDIETIDNPEVLKESALQYNLLWIARFNSTNIEDVNDQYGSYYTGHLSRVMDELRMDIRQLTFGDSPSGVDQLNSQVTRLKRG